MGVLSKEDLAELTGYEAENCVSIFIPAHSSGVEVNNLHDAIVFKNNLQAARRVLLDKGLQQRTVDSVLKPGFDLVDDREFWNSQSEGLAVYISEGFIKIIKLPFKLKEELFVNSNFYIVPLLPVMSEDEHFFLLLLSKKDARIYRGDGFGMELLEVEGLPNGMDDVIHFEEKDSRQLMRRAGGGAGRDAINGGGSYHGHGSGLADEPEYISQYLKEVDQTLWVELLANEKSPLILAGTEGIIGQYRTISKYKNIVESMLSGNFDHEDKNTIYQKVKEIAAPLFEENTRKALKTYYENSTGELTSSIPQDVIPASFYSQISDLFVVRDVHIWGKFDQASNELEIHEEPQPGDTCLMNKAVVQTIKNGGSVHVVDQGRMPAESTIAAFMRF
ncbi:MAG: hypothetical protein JWQ28_3187 [Pedobacter sp.]|jgi:hypothetical protein|nr:hypothetical protein [Pedobacter sp.]